MPNHHTLTPERVALGAALLRLAPLYTALDDALQPAYRSPAPQNDADERRSNVAPRRAPIDLDAADQRQAIEDWAAFVCRTIRRNPYAVPFTDDEGVTRLRLVKGEMVPADTAERIRWIAERASRVPDDLVDALLDDAAQYAGKATNSLGLDRIDFAPQPPERDRERPMHLAGIARLARAAVTR